MRVQMLGLCRFSYLGLRGYQVEHDSIAARRAYLYDPDRLARAGCGSRPWPCRVGWRRPI